MTEKRLSERQVEALYRSLIDIQIQEKSYDIIRDLAAQEGIGIWGQEQKAFLDTRTLKSLFYSENWVYIICDLIAMKISNQPLFVYKEEIFDGKKVYTQAENHPLQERIDNPNTFQSYASFMYCTAVDLVLCGNAILWKGISGDQLFIFPAETVQLEFNDKADLISYVKLYGSNDDLKIVGKYLPEDIIHIRRPNPSSLYWGLSPFIAGRANLLFNRFTLEYLNSYYQKGALPGFALEMAQDANESLAIRLLRSFEQAFTGRSNQRRTLLLPKGVSLKQVSATLAEQQLKEYLDMNKEDILAILKVPKHEVGLQTQGSLGSEEYKTALKNFWATTIIPTMGFISGEMNRAFKEELGEGYSLQFYLEDVDILQEDKMTKAQLASQMKATHTVNEIRKELYELEPIDGGDVLQGTQPQNPFALSLHIPDTKDAKLQTDHVAPQPEVEFNAADNLIKANGSWFENHKRKIDKATKEPQAKMADLAIKMFADQAIDIVRNIEKISGVRKGKDDKMKELILAEVEKQAVEWLKGYKDIEHGVSIDGWILSEDTPVKVPGLKLDVTEKVRKELLKDIEQRARSTFQFLNETTTNEVYGIIKGGLDNNDTLQQIASRITEKYSDPDKMMFRGERIARTETLKALSIGQDRAIKKASEDIKDLKKMWISTDDNRTRGKPGGLYEKSKCDHWTLHGQVVNHDKKFFEKRSGEYLDFPRDPSGSAANVINCRCTWIVLPSKEMAQFQRTESEVQPNE